MRSVAPLFVIFALGCAAYVHGDMSEHYYEHYDLIPLIANKVGPFANPTETYPYYSLPFCKPDTLEHQDHELGEILSGDRKVNTPYGLRFKVNNEFVALCSKTLMPEDVAKFSVACEEDYWFEMFLDELPIMGYIGDHEAEDPLLGHTSSSRHFLYTHLHFKVTWNGNNVIHVNVSTDKLKRVDITNPTHKGIPVTFSYSVEWVETNIKFADRMKWYSQSHFLPSTIEIHWLSIFNSLILVLLLTVFLATIIVRIVKRDLSQYMATDDEEDPGEAETGWKLLHGDVFRFPPYVNLLAAAVGTGVQLFAVAALLLFLSLLGLFHPQRRGAILTASIVLYSLCGFVGGYTSARLYKQLGGAMWVRNILLTTVLFPAPLVTTFMLLNTIAFGHASTAALPFGTILVVLALFMFVTFPLTVLGGITGRNSRPFDAPCRNKKAQRQIPARPWHLSTPVHLFVTGFLPFSAISIELHYIVAAVWGHRVYTLFGILSIAFIMLLIVTSMIVVAMVYFQLASENHRWWWMSFHSGLAVGVFMYVYCFFYYQAHSEMTGLLQTTFFFGYMGVVSYAFALMLGAVGFYSALFFVRFIYGSIKIE